MQIQDGGRQTGNISISGSQHRDELATKFQLLHLFLEFARLNYAICITNGSFFLLQNQGGCRKTETPTIIFRWFTTNQLSFASYS